MGYSTIQISIASVRLLADEQFRPMPLNIPRASNNTYSFGNTFLFSLRIGTVPYVQS